MPTYPVLKQRLEIIRKEVEDGRNTADRVGSALLDLLEYASWNEKQEGDRYASLKVLLDKITMTVGQLELGDKDATMFVKKSDYLMEIDRIRQEVYEKVKNELGQTDYVTTADLELKSNSIIASVARQAVDEASEYVLGQVALKNYVTSGTLDIRENAIRSAVKAQGDTIINDVAAKYSTKAELTQEAGRINLLVEEAVTDEMGSYITRSEFNATNNGMTLRVNALTDNQGEMSGQLQILANSVGMFVEETDEEGKVLKAASIVAAINDAGSEIALRADKIKNFANEVEIIAKEKVKIDIENEVKELREEIDGKEYITESQAKSMITVQAGVIRLDVQEDLKSFETDLNGRGYITEERAKSILDLSANALVLTFDKNLEKKVSDAVEGAVGEAFESVEYVTKNEFEISNKGLTETITTAETTVKNALVHIQTTESSLKDTKDEFSKTIKDVETIKDTVEDIETAIESNSYLKLTKTEFETNIANKVIEKKGGEFVSSTAYNSFIQQLPNTISLGARGEIYNADGTLQEALANLTVGAIMDADGRLKSNISLSADQIEFDGDVLFSQTIHTSNGVVSLTVGKDYFEVNEGDRYVGRLSSTSMTVTDRLTGSYSTILDGIIYVADKSNQVTIKSDDVTIDSASGAHIHELSKKANQSELDELGNSVNNVTMGLSMLEQKVNTFGQSVDGLNDYKKWVEQQINTLNSQINTLTELFNALN